MGQVFPFDYGYEFCMCECLTVRVCLVKQIFIKQYGAGCPHNIVWNKVLCNEL